MLWRRRRLALAMAHILCCLGLIPAFALMVWSVGDGPDVSRALALPLTLPPINVKDAGFALVFVGFGAAVFRLYRVIFDLRERTLMGDADAIPLASVQAEPDLQTLPVPIVLVWTRTWRSRIRFLAGFCISLVAVVGISALAVESGLIDFLRSLQGLLFWALTGEVVGIALLLSVVPLAFLYAATRGPRGVIADDVGVSVWSRYGPRTTIAWTDARLLEMYRGARRKNAQNASAMYTLYAADGKIVRWNSYPESKRSQKLIASDVNDSLTRAAAIVSLAMRHAGLSLRTFDEASVDQSSSLTGPENALLQSSGLLGSASAYIIGALAITAGGGVASLLYHSSTTSATSALSLVSLATLSLSALWSFANTFRAMLRLPYRLNPNEQPAWRTLSGQFADQAVSLRLTSSRSAALGGVVRTALLLLGSGSGLATIIAALVSGTAPNHTFRTASLIGWLALTFLIVALRLFMLLRHDQIALVANADGLHDLTKPSARSIPWADIASLRFTWSRHAGFSYTASTRNGLDITWASQNRSWREAAEPGNHPEVWNATNVDGDTFAAIVAAGAGLTPVQALAF